MITTITVTIVLLAALPILLWIPLRLKVITAQSEYSLSWGVMVSGRYNHDQDIPNFELSILGIRRRWTFESVIRSMMQSAIQQTSERAEPNENGVRRATRSNKLFRRLQKLISAIQVRVLKMTIDTGDYALNGLLYPVALRNSSRKRIDINFEGINELEMELDMRPIALLKVWMR